MDDDIHPIDPPPGTVPAGLAPYRPPRRRFGLLAASVVLAAGVGGGFAVSQLAHGGQPAGPAVTTSQGADDGESQVATPDTQAQPAAQAGEPEDD
jgi:hypothetical protein